MKIMQRPGKYIFQTRCEYIPVRLDFSSLKNTVLKIYFPGLLIVSILVSLFFTVSVFAAPTNIILEKAPINTYDKASIKRGAKFFATTCMVCHSLEYLKRDSIAQAAGIDYSKMPIQAQEWWANSPPPDLSLIAKARGANWLYTYLHSFYQDPSRPSGNNNLLVDNTNMPNPFPSIQGIQVLVVDKKQLIAQGADKIPWFEAVKLEKPGTMSAEEFDRTIADVVNFLVYASEPNKTQRERLGWWVLGFLIIFLVLVYFLKRIYWKTVKKKP